MADKTFEENLATLETIVSQLEKGDVPLEEALKQFETGIKISQDLQKTLQNAETSLAKIVNADGSMSDFNKGE
ncbi:exodeoxyribonuclease VII small subunit [Weissella sagaensis]|jgi:exodeoxyribonuclease VII small subunit|uniref:Exodeoxyribonuclease 7 small subunit n=1 Tax=Weissella sagaensis TaxID=2559928 RepID=A0ABW1RU14_9LACO|nr:exodeoxyribonuclease VII small subunit [Weissella sagaensis]KAA8433245.1 exodeoxyribonuclease VII small subunit [Weissella paramesenteroides]MBU7567169.1 exodeoxyribonuclease VII small subunit [Weissella hellenica]KAA8439325.1 exodeoxyribonuclease VII small subunit [Weissella paramesenteroides]QDJ59226.1 exodeoxyribonuclease VII small subunit [Weissella hellenica]QEA56520.1 exodeoxyribonuclease VII small subunit [Weissella hellenica]